MKDKSEKSAKTLSHEQTVDILNAMDTKQRKSLLRHFVSSTAEISIQSTDTDDEFLEVEPSVEEEITVQHPQP